MHHGPANRLRDLREVAFARLSAVVTLIGRRAATEPPVMRAVCGLSHRTALVTAPAPPEMRVEQRPRGRIHAAVNAGSAARSRRPAPARRHGPPGGCGL